MQKPAEVLSFLLGGGELGALIRAKDWSATPLGPVEAWPQSLKTSLGILLNSRYPMFVFWGPHLVKIYNDAYRPITGHKHPWALGRPAHEVWPEIWHDIKPLVDRALGGDPTWSDDLMLVMERNGFPEEVYFTFSYSPIPDESGGVGGMFCACTETTGKVLGERRLRTLRDLAAAPAEARTVAEASVLSAGALSTNRADVPFALIYLVGEDGTARLVAQTGARAGDPIAPVEIAAGLADAAWPAHTVIDTRLPQHVSTLAGRFTPVPAGPWPEPPSSAMVLPLIDRGLERGVGAIALGISSRRPFDDEYRGWFDLVGGQISASITNARAAEEERKRAEALAEIDRAKTAFFSNVSHEFRTPLSLMLGPTEDALASPEQALRGENLQVVHRNELRLLKLVNTLLDFSRIEAGRIDARYERVDIATLTEELASVFRSAVERAGLRLHVTTGPTPDDVWVDRDMWEKIVLNLLSNALKHTFEGAIAVDVRGRDGRVEVTVRDTGVGIAAEHLPHIFERFHRVPAARARTHEGTGIGLALVHELVALHRGTIRVESVVDVGTAFTVTIPAGSSHLPQDRLSAPRPPAAAAQGTTAFVEEALRWLPSPGEAGAPAAPHERSDAVGASPAGVHRVLVADDNSDMREYLARLLAPYFVVETAVDGLDALERFRAHRPHVVLSDVMMPRLDGLALVKAVRAEPAGAETPVVLLSARAGEEARVEGLESGADDYLVKPFSARELVATVKTHAALAAMRQAVASADRAQHLLVSLNDATRNLFNPDDVTWAIVTRVGRHFGVGRCTYGEIDAAQEHVIVTRDYTDGVASVAGRHRLDDFGPSLIRDLKLGRTAAVPDVAEDTRTCDPRSLAAFAAIETRALVCVPLVKEGRFVALLVIHHPEVRRWSSDDVSLVEQVAERTWFAVENARAETALRESRDVLALAMRGGRMGAWSREVRTNDVWWSRELEEIFGLSPGGFAGTEAGFLALVHEDDRPALERAVESAIRAREDYVVEFRFRHADGSWRWMEGRGRAVYTPEGVPRSLYGLGIDITERKRAEEALAAARDSAESANRLKDQFLATLSHELRTPLNAILGYARMLRTDAIAPEKRARAIEVIERNAVAQNQLVEDLLDISRITSGKVRLETEVVPIAVPLREAIEGVRPAIEAKGIDLAVGVDPFAGTVRADATRLQQVFWNLLSNAVKFTPGGGRIGVSLERANGHVVVVVSDSGIGISPDFLPFVFDPFRQADGRFTREHGGLGLGLAICKQLVELHGGEIQASSEGPGRGATFTVRLPRHASTSIEYGGGGSALRTPRS